MTTRQRKPVRGAATGARAREIDLDSVPLGPATYMVRAKTDKEGRLTYLVGNRAKQFFKLGAGFASREIAIIDALRVGLLCDPSSNRVLGLVGHMRGENRLFLFGDLWGRWIGDDGRRHPCKDPLRDMTEALIPVVVDRNKRRVSLEFFLNIYNRESFSSELRELLDEGAQRYQLSLTFEHPSGKYVGSRLIANSAETGMTSSSIELKGFALIWPNDIARPRAFDPRGARAQPAVPRKARAEQPGAGPRMKKKEPERPRIKLRPKASTSAPDPEVVAQLERARMQTGGPTRARMRPRRKTAEPNRPAQPSAAAPGSAPTRPKRATPRKPSAPKPIPITNNLSLNEMLSTIGAEPDHDRQWRMVESNLSIARPERTYMLIANFSDLIADRTGEWRPTRLRTAFRDQPGSILVAIMEAWTVNQILAVAEENAEREKMLAWLKEREVDRLLRLDLDRPLGNTDDARADLNIDRNADDRAVKKAWRTQLSFLNADIGRKNERAIHQRKDEIAKRLQEARNLILNKRPI